MHTSNQNPKPNTQVRKQAHDLLVMEQRLVTFLLRKKVLLITSNDEVNLEKRKEIEQVCELTDKIIFNIKTKL